MIRVTGKNTQIKQRTLWEKSFNGKKMSEQNTKCPVHTPAQVGQGSINFDNGKNVSCKAIKRQLI